MIRSPAGFDGGDRIKRYLDYYQPSYGVMMLSAGQFSPASLFSSGEQGAWYDPSDLSTMFQDSAGTTPVTAVGQPVGLLLDKSKGLTLGAELVTNGDFATDSDWVKGTGWTISGGVASYDGTNAPNAMYQAGAALIAPKSYRVTITVTLTQGALLVRPQFNATAGQYQINSSGTYTLILQGQAASGFGVVAGNSGGRFIGTVDNISVRELPGNHASQSTPGSRPVLRQEATGQYYLAFDGTDDSLATASITPGADKAQVFAGIRKTSDAALAIVAELSATIASNAGSFALTAPNSAAANYNFSSKGTTQTDNTVTTYTSPLTSVLSGIADIAGASNLIRVNGAQVGSVLTTQGTGNYLAYPLYIGRRGGTSNPFTGHLYSLILRFGANLSDAQIASTEAWVNGKTGAY